MRKKRGSGAPTLILETIANTAMISNSKHRYDLVQYIFFEKNFKLLHIQTGSHIFVFVYFFNVLFLFLCKNSTSHVPPFPFPRRSWFAQNLIYTTMYMRVLSQNFQLFRPHFGLRRFLLIFPHVKIQPTIVAPPYPRRSLY